MNFSWYKMDIERQPATRLVHVYIFRKSQDMHDHVIIWYYDEKNKCWKETVVKPGDPISPSMIVPEDFLELFLEAIIAKGVKPKEASFIEWKLQATQEHLSDLQKLLKLKSKD